MPNLEVTQILNYWRIWSWTDRKRESSDEEVGGGGGVDIDRSSCACYLNSQ